MALLALWQLFFFGIMLCMRFIPIRKRLWRCVNRLVCCISVLGRCCCFKGGSNDVAQGGDTSALRLDAENENDAAEAPEVIEEACGSKQGTDEEAKESEDAMWCTWYWFHLAVQAGFIVREMRVTTILNGWWYWQVVVSYAALLTAFLCTTRQVWKFSNVRNVDENAREAADQVLDMLMLPLNYCYLAAVTVRALRAQEFEQELMIATVAAANAWQSWALWSVLKLFQRVVGKGAASGERSTQRKPSVNLDKDNEAPSHQSTPDDAKIRSPLTHPRYPTSTPRKNSSSFTSHQSSLSSQAVLAPKRPPRRQASTDSMPVRQTLSAPEPVRVPEPQTSITSVMEVLSAPEFHQSSTLATDVNEALMKLEELPCDARGSVDFEDHDLQCDGDEPCNEDAPLVPSYAEPGDSEEGTSVHRENDDLQRNIDVAWNEDAAHVPSNVEPSDGQEGTSIHRENIDSQRDIDKPFSEDAPHVLSYVERSDGEEGTSVHRENNDLERAIDEPLNEDAPHVTSYVEPSDSNDLERDKDELLNEDAHYYVPSNAEPSDGEEGTSVPRENNDLHRDADEPLNEDAPQVPLNVEPSDVEERSLVHRENDDLQRDIDEPLNEAAPQIPSNVEPSDGEEGTSAHRENNDLERDRDEWLNDDAHFVLSHVEPSDGEEGFSPRFENDTQDSIESNSPERAEMNHAQHIHGNPERLGASTPDSNGEDAEFGKPLAYIASEEVLLIEDPDHVEEALPWLQRETYSPHPHFMDDLHLQGSATYSPALPEWRSASPSSPLLPKAWSSNSAYTTPETSHRGSRLSPIHPSLSPAMGPAASPGGNSRSSSPAVDKQTEARMSSSTMPRRRGSIVVKDSKRKLVDDQSKRVPASRVEVEPGKTSKVMTNLSQVVELGVQTWVATQVCASLLELLIKGVVSPYSPTFCNWVLHTCTGCSEWYDANIYPMIQGAVVLFMAISVGLVIGYERSFSEAIENTFKAVSTEQGSSIRSKSIPGSIVFTFGSLLIVQFWCQDDADQRVQSYMFHSLYCCVLMASLAVINLRVYPFGGLWMKAVLSTKLFEESLKAGEASILEVAKNIFFACISFYGSMVAVSWLVPPEWDVAPVYPLYNVTCTDNIYSRIEASTKTDHMSPIQSMSPWLPLCHKTPLRCVRGYEGRPSVSCSVDQRLEFDGKCTVVGCGPPNKIPHANFEPSSQPQIWTTGMRVVYSCDLGYHGSPVATCNSDGTWNHIGSPCSLVGCGALQSFLQMQISAGWKSVMTPSVRNASLLTSSHDGEVVEFACHKGLLGKPVATCLKGGDWVLSDACTAFKTAKGCSCERHWTHCEGLLSNVCHEFFGCASNAGSPTSWCRITPGSCPQNALGIFDLEPTWDYCAASNFHNEWAPVPVGAAQGWIPLVQLISMSFFFCLSAASFAWCCFHSSKLTMNTWQSLQPRLLLARDSCSFAVRHLPGSLRRYWRILSYNLRVRVEQLDVWSRRRVAEVVASAEIARQSVATKLTQSRTQVDVFATWAGERWRSVVDFLKQGLSDLSSRARERRISFADNVKHCASNCAHSVRERCCPLEPAANDETGVRNRCNASAQSFCEYFRACCDNISRNRCNAYAQSFFESFRVCCDNISRLFCPVNVSSFAEPLLPTAETPKAGNLFSEDRVEDKLPAKRFPEDKLSTVLPSGGDKESTITRHAWLSDFANDVNISLPKSYSLEQPRVTRSTPPSQNRSTISTVSATSPIVCKSSVKPPGLALAMPARCPVRPVRASVPMAKPIEPPCTLDLAISPRF